jgi:hypothetical protein
MFPKSNNEHKNKFFGENISKLNQQKFKNDKKSVYVFSRILCVFVYVKVIYRMGETLNIN